MAGAFYSLPHCLSLNNIFTGSAKDIDVAVAAARRAFKTTWGKNVTGFERSGLLNKLADLIERDKQELAEIETLNNGKAVKIARYFNYQPTISSCSIIFRLSEILTSATRSNAFVIMPAGRTRSSVRLVPLQ